MSDAQSFEALLARLEELFGELESLDEPTRGRLYELLDAIDALHRIPLKRAGEALAPDELARLREHDPALAWLFDAYGVGIDERSRADAALESVRPYIHSHGGSVEVLEASGGIVRVKLAGSCSGCTASAITLSKGIEEALRESFPGFVAMQVEEEPAEPHAPPGPTLIELENRLG